MLGGIIGPPCYVSPFSILFACYTCSYALFLRPLILVVVFVCSSVGFRSAARETLWQPDFLHPDSFLMQLFCLLSVPVGAGAGKRRHSYQSGVPGLTKDMDRLRVSSAATAASHGGAKGGVSPRGSTRRRPSSARRSSRSGNNGISKPYSVVDILKCGQI